MGLAIAGTHNGGSTSVLKMDVTPDGSRLVLVGNFVTVNALRNEQVAMLDLTGSAAQLANWQTAFYQGTCSSSFNSYLRDVDISPDGSYFVITTTGAYGGGAQPLRRVGALGLRSDRGRAQRHLGGVHRG